MQTRSKQQLENTAVQSGAPLTNAVSKLPNLPSNLPPITVPPAKSRDKPLPSNHLQASVNMAGESQVKSHSSAALLQDPKNLENLELLLKYADEFKAFLKAKAAVPSPPIDVVESTNDHHSVTQPPPPPLHPPHNFPQNLHNNTFGPSAPNPPRPDFHHAPLHVHDNTSPYGDMDGRTHEVFKQLQALLPKFTPAAQQWNMLEKNPLREDYQHMPFPKDFKLPAMDRYNGSSDPELHLKHYTTHMIMHAADDMVLCRCFASTLTGRALDWFSSLPPRSITSFTQLGRMFAQHFASSRAQRRPSTSLLHLRQRHDESLSAYHKRFND